MQCEQRSYLEWCAWVKTGADVANSTLLQGTSTTDTLRAHANRYEAVLMATINALWELGNTPRTNLLTQRIQEIDAYILSIRAQLADGIQQAVDRTTLDAYADQREIRRIQAIFIECERVAGKVIGVVQECMKHKELQSQMQKRMLMNIDLNDYRMPV